MTRLDWDHYFMGFAEAARARSSCDRRFGGVGAVLVAGLQVVATGYNGAVRGMPDCDEVGHLMEDGHCLRTVHAEMNALAQAAYRGVSILGGSSYSTVEPCWGCFRVLVNAGVVDFVYAQDYLDERDPRIEDACRTLNIRFRRL